MSPPESPLGGSERKPETWALSLPQLRKALGNTFEAIAGGIRLTGDDYCADILEGNAQQLAEAYAELASRNKGVRRFLTSMLVGSDWAQVIVLTAGTVIPMAAHHGLLPALDIPFLSSTVPATPPPSPEVQAEQEARASAAPPAAPPAAEPVPGEEAAEPPPAPPEGKVSEIGGDGGVAKPVTDEPGQSPD